MITGAQAWAAYSAAIIGRPVKDAEKKFSALPEVERAAWTSVAEESALLKAVNAVRPSPT